MSMRSGIFNSTETTLTPEGLVRGNRAVDASFLAQLFASFYTNGVFLDADGGGFQTTVREAQVGDLTAMTVDTAAGACHINGYFGFEDTAQTETFPVSTAAQCYVHVLRLDLTDGTIAAQWIKCTAAQSGWQDASGAPLPRRTDTVWDLITARADIPAGRYVLQQTDITDLRQDRTLCGMVAGAVTAFDSDAWTVQMRAYLHALEETAAALPADSAAYFALNKLDADLSNLSAELHAGAVAALAAAHTHPASAIAAGTLSAGVRAAADGDLTAARIRNIAFAQVLPENAAGIGEGDLLGVFA